MTTSTLHQLAIGLGLSEKTLYSWNKNFKIIPTQNEAGQFIYSSQQIEFILHIHHLIKERGFTIVGAKKEIENETHLDKNKAETIQKLTQIRAFLVNLKEDYIVTPLHKVTKFETERLFIRPTTKEDAPFVLKMLQSPKWIQYIGDRKVHSIEQAEEYIETKMVQPFKEFGFSNYTVLRKSDATKLGCVSLYKRPTLEFVDIGFALLPEYEGQGYAFESSNRIKQAAFENFGIQEICGVTLEENSASRSLLEKLGLRFLKTIRWADDEEELMFYWMSLVD